MIRNSFTGHMNHGSPIESDDSCDTCDGARCDYCREVWYVDDVPYDTEEEAEAAQKENDTLIDLKDVSEPVGFTLINDDLCALVYKSGFGYLFTSCVKSSVLYDNLLKETIKDMAKFNECTCTDKLEASSANSCDVLSVCNDRNCYAQMKSGKTTTKLFYD